MGWVGMGLSTTRIQPNLIGWSNPQFAVDREDDWIEQIRPPMGGGWVGQSCRFEKQRENDGKQ